MPRGPRRDAPLAVQHVMLRGIERRRIFIDQDDYEAFTARLDLLIPELGFRCFAWALMPNHVHLALQTAHVPLSRLMARLGTGYARYFNRRHDRVGHLFQNRFKSRLVDGDVDLMGLLLYIHRNPIEAKLVCDAAELADFPWCGHGALVGRRPPRAFESSAAALRVFADDPKEARRRLRRWMDDPTDADEPLAHVADDRRVASPSRVGPVSREAFERLIDDVCSKRSIPRDALAGRNRRIVAARAELSQRAIRELGLSSRAIARILGVSDSTISRALARK